MNPFFRRLERLENAGGGEIVIVDLYAGMTNAEAILHRFGPEGPPRGAQIIFVTNSPSAPLHKPR